MRVFSFQTLAAIALIGCNGLTGAGDFQIDRGDDDDGDAATTVGQTGPAGPGAQAGAGVGPSSGAGGSTEVPENVVDATGVAITEVAVYQGVKVSVMKNGAASTPNAPVIAGRPALVRFFTTVSNPTGAPLTARLTIGQQKFDQPIAGMTNSVDANMASTINFDVPPEALVAGATFSARILEAPESSTNPSPDASYPSEGQTDLFVKNGKPVKIKLIPLVSDGFTPDTSPAALELYRKRVFELYPTSEVIMSAAAPRNVNADFNTENGWGNTLDQLSAERASAQVDADEFWYGLIQTTGSYQTAVTPFLGLANLGFPSDPYTRVGIGVGYADADSADTFAHEIGHTHAREHSPGCEAGGPDPAYPYPQGLIGSWGYSVHTKQLVPPTGSYDMMTYCMPWWISDYVYGHIHTFKEQMQGAYVLTPESELDQEYERYLVYPDHVEAATPRRFAKPPLSGTESVSVTDETGASRVVTGHFVRWDHIDGGVLMLKKGTSPTRRLRFTPTALKQPRPIDLHL